MEIKKILVMTMAILVCGTVVAGAFEDETAARIKKVGSVCIEGEDCASGAASGGSVASAGGSVEDNYNQSCKTCHAAGIAGAPKLGDVAGWEPRLAKGMDTLYTSAISGMPPGMPAKGMCFSCSDDDLRALVDWMVEQSQ